MTSFREIVSREDAHESGVFPKRPVAIVRGQGARLWDVDGKEYIDAGASYGCMNVGHGNPEVLAALREQSERLVYVQQTLYTPQRANLLERLSTLSPGLTRSFLSNSGAEAVEAAIKFARAHTGRAGVVAAKRGFHGRTLGALSATWKPEYREPFEPLVPGFSFAAYGDEEALKQAVTRETAAVLLEPVQGEAGVVVPPPSYLRAAAQIAHDAGALLVLDEIQTGLGRTGRLLAREHSGVEPDIVCLGKSLAGGLPVGATLLRPEICTLPKAAHGNTFGGSPLVCAAANATFAYLLRERLWERAATLGERATKQLSSIDSGKIREVRGVGLMLAVELREKAGPFLSAMIERGVIPLAAGSTTIRLLPPLVVTESEMDRVVAVVRDVLADGR
ncbi:MAG TPA: aspartate aminotransferase family protein [Candidatus Thermoplasmatota archaeon]|nr:aspartate aminotransferase family protein [Candidatus Thermoplasmatota archaeon]